MTEKYTESTEELCAKLKSMKLSGMAEELERQESNPNHDLIPFQERLDNIINSDWNTRYNKKADAIHQKGRFEISSSRSG